MVQAVSRVIQTCIDVHDQIHGHGDTQRVVKRLERLYLRATKDREVRLPGASAAAPAPLTPPAPGICEVIRILQWYVQVSLHPEPRTLAPTWAS